MSILDGQHLILMGGISKGRDRIWRRHGDILTINLENDDNYVVKTLSSHGCIGLSAGDAKKIGNSIYFYGKL